MNLLKKRKLVNVKVSTPTSDQSKASCCGQIKCCGQIS